MSKTLFSDGVSTTKGTRVTAAFLNAVNNHQHDGTVADGDGGLVHATGVTDVDGINLNSFPVGNLPPMGSTLRFQLGTTCTNGPYNGSVALLSLYRDSDGNQLIMTWHGYGNDIWTRVSTDSGTTWTVWQRLLDSSFQSQLVPPER